MSTAPRPRPRPHRRLAVVAAVAVAAALVPLAPASAQQTFNRGIARACPPDAPNAFTDDDGNVFEAEINCIAFWKIVRGVGGSRYEPNVTVSRAAMATFIVNLMETAESNFTFNPNPPDAFDDDNGNVHEPNINKLADAGVVRGTAPRRYSPAHSVRRDQMATFINQAIGVVTGQKPSSDQNFFPDDGGNPHEPNINALASIGVVQGDTQGRYNPRRNVNRGAMAAFIARGGDYLGEKGFWPPVTGVNKTAYGVSPAGAAVLTFGAVRQYGTKLNQGTTVNIRLFPAADLNFTDGKVVFPDTQSPSGVADENAADAVVVAVNGARVTAAQEVTATAGADGNVTFVVQAAKDAEVVPVVWTDVDGAGTAGGLDLDDENIAEEPFGVGGGVAWTLTEAGAGAATPVVQGVELTAGLFAATNGRTYRFDAGDTFRLNGTAITAAQFRSVVNPGDALSLSYAPDGSSTFDVTNDAVHGPAAPQVRAVVAEGDADGIANDVRIGFTLPWNNSTGTAYKIQRNLAECTSGEMDERTWQDTTASTDTNPAVDKDVPPGCYRYRLVATSPALVEQVTPATSAGVASDVVQVPGNPDSTPPKIADVRATADNGADGTGGANGAADKGDTFRFRFDERMHDSTATGTFRVSDPDGTIADVVCAVEGRAGNATCALNTAPVVTTDGAILAPGQELTVTFTGAVTAVQGGQTAGLQYGLTIISVSADFQDLAANQLQLSGSDVFIEVAA